MKYKMSAGGGALATGIIGGIAIASGNLTAGNISSAATATIAVDQQRDEVETAMNRTVLSALIATTHSTQLAASAAVTYIGNMLSPSAAAAAAAEGNSQSNAVYGSPSPATFTGRSNDGGDTWVGPAGVSYENIIDYQDDLIHNEFVQIFFCILYTTVFVLGVFGNVLVCYVVLRNRAMQTVTNIFITNLALSDILLCVLAVPFTPLYTFMKRWAFGRTLCHLVSFAQGCSIYISTLTLTSIAIDRYFVIIYPFHPRMKLSTCIGIIISIWVIALLATLPYGMYMKVVSGAVFMGNGTLGNETGTGVGAGAGAGTNGDSNTDAKYDALHWNNDIEFVDYDSSLALSSSSSSSSSLSASAAALSSSPSISMPMSATEAYLQLMTPTTVASTGSGSSFYYGNGTNGSPFAKSYCEENWPSEQYRKVFGSVTTILQFILPFIIISICYTWVSVKLNARARAKPGSKSSRREEADRDRKKRTNRMLIAMVAVFGLSWLPINVVNIFDDFYVKSHEWRFYNLFFFVAHSIAMSSTCYNPFLYAWLNENFRKEFKHVLPCFNPSNNNNILNIARGYNRSERNTCGPRLRHGSDCGGVDGGATADDDGDENGITQETTCLPRERLLIIPREPTYGNGGGSGPLSPQRFSYSAAGGGGGGSGGAGGNTNATVRHVEILLNESGCGSDSIRSARTRHCTGRGRDEIDEVDSADEQTVEMRFCETPFVSQSDHTTGISISMVETSTTSNAADHSTLSDGGGEAESIRRSN